MKAAVTSQNFKTVTNHAGKARRYIIFEVGDDNAPIEIERLDLSKDMAFHEFHEDGPHPLDGVDVLISASFGSGFASRMQKRGIIASISQQQNPLEAVKEYFDCGQCLPNEEHRTRPNNN